MTAISPLDGRYADRLVSLREVFSEYSLIRHRLQVEIEWLKMLADTPEIAGCPALEVAERQWLDRVHRDFSLPQAKRVKQHESVTNHDVKAVELFLRELLEQNPAFQSRVAFVHFACTSEDINNLSYGLMLLAARDRHLLPALEQVLDRLVQQAERYKDMPMMCRTHGQPATPSTLGKELAIYIHRLGRQLEQLQAQPVFGKLNGATGNFNAHIASCSDIDWMSLSRRFVEGLGLVWNPHTTQIESHDYVAELMNHMVLVNTILIDLCRDFWSYISLGYFCQRSHADEVGSSTMPHKVNPIDFENAEGNLGLANAVASHLSHCLPISRWQRDLTDSTTLRNLGVVFAHVDIALQSLCRGLDGLEVDSAVIGGELDANWQILAEAIQAVMRWQGERDAYEQLKSLTRGREVDRDMLHDFIRNTSLPEALKQRLLSLSPADYTGNAGEQAEMILEGSRGRGV